MTAYYYTDGVVLDEASENHSTADATERTELEFRASVASLDELHTRRRLLIERNAKLFALYGNFGHYDDHRKRMVEALQVKYRAELSAGRPKTPSVDEVEAAAYGSEEYSRFIDNALQEKIDYLKLATEIGEIEEMIRSREIELQVYGKEITLGR